MGAFAAISAAFFYLPFFVGFWRPDVILLESCAGDVAPWLYGTRFCAESWDECLLVPACLLEFLFEGCFLVFCGLDIGCFLGFFLVFCGLDIRCFLAFFTCFADWSCAQAHLGPTYFTDTIHFSDGVSD